MLLFFTFTTTLGLVKFRNQRHAPFSDDWWIWLVFTGWSIGCVCSVKWVGMFITALVGLYTIEDLWEKFGDLSMPIVSISFAELKKKKEKKDSRQDTIAHVHHPLGCPNHLPYNPSLYRLRFVLQNTLPHPQPIGPR